jgi:hypothetical protein
VTLAQPNHKASQDRQHQEVHRAGHHLVRAGSAGGNVRAWPVAEANAIIVAARGERILSKPRRPISETSFSMLAWEGRTAQQMRGDGEAEAK